MAGPHIKRRPGRLPGVPYRRRLSTDLPNRSELDQLCAMRDAFGIVWRLMGGVFGSDSNLPLAYFSLTFAANIYPLAPAPHLLAAHPGGA